MGNVEANASLEAKSFGPLAGVKVLELGSLIAGPFCSRILAEFGAEVIKIEAPGEGDPLRRWRKMYGETSLWWLLQARNKYSITVNLKVSDGIGIVKRLAQERQKELKDKNLPDLEKVFKKLEDGADRLRNQETTDRKKALVELNDLATASGARSSTAPWGAACSSTTSSRS